MGKRSFQGAELSSSEKTSPLAVWIVLLLPALAEGVRPCREQSERFPRALLTTHFQYSVSFILWSPSITSYIQTENLDFFLLPGDETIWPGGGREVIFIVEGSDLSWFQ